MVSGEWWVVGGEGGGVEAPVVPEAARRLPAARLELLDLLRGDDAHLIGVRVRVRVRVRVGARVRVAARVRVSGQWSESGSGSGSGLDRAAHGRLVEEGGRLLLHPAAHLDEIVAQAAGAPGEGFGVRGRATAGLKVGVRARARLGLGLGPGSG